MIGDGLMRSPAAPFLAACAVLGCVLVVEWLPVAASPQVPAAHIARPTGQAAKTEDDRDTDDWADTVLVRPLFTISRRPAKTASGLADSGGPGMPRLAGIMISPYGRRAIFMPDAGKPLVLAEGAKVDAAVIRRITNDAVYVSGPSGESILHPTLDKQRASTGPESGTSPFAQGHPFPPPGGFRPGFRPPGAPQAPADDNTNSDNDDNAPANEPRPHPFMGGAGGPGNRGPILPRGRE